MARKGSNVYLRCTGKWEGRYVKGRYENGRIRYGYVSGMSREEAQRKRDEKVQELEREARQAQHLRDRLLFQSVATDWLKERAPLLKAATVCKYRNNLALHLLPVFGDMRITDITRDDVALYRSKLLASGGKDSRGLSANTAKSILSVLRSVLDYGSMSRHVTVADFGSYMIMEKESSLRVLSMNEQNLLMDYILSDLDRSGLGILLVLYTGIRLGELCALKWQDISFKERHLSIHSTVERIQTPDDPKRKTKLHFDEPKSRASIRKIPLQDGILRILKGMAGKSGTFFLTGHKDVHVDPRTMENRFKTILHTCGIADARFHTLRHTFATRCVEAGVDPKTLSKILGHASVRITLDRYVHPSEDEMRRNMDMLSGAIARSRNTAS